MYTSNCADYYGCLPWPKSSVLEGHTVIVHKRMLRDQKQAKKPVSTCCVCVYSISVACF